MTFSIMSVYSITLKYYFITVTQVKLLSNTANYNMPDTTCNVVTIGLFYGKWYYVHFLYFVT